MSGASHCIRIAEMFVEGIKDFSSDSHLYFFAANNNNAEQSLGGSAERYSG